MSVLRTSVVILAAFAVSSAEFAHAASNKNRIVAQSNVQDPATRQIVRTVANETLKTISTKDSIPDVDGPILVPTKVEVEEAPGTRAPAEAAPSPEVSSKVNLDVSTVPADQALLWLKNGNTRYLKNTVRKDGSKPSDRQRLSKSEKPHAIVLACSDSRVPPETVFDQSLGEIYVIRTAGQAIDSAVIASIEHAVETLDPKLIVVLGHTSCSAVQTALDSDASSVDDLASVIRPRLPVRTNERGIASATSKGLETESSANAHGAASDLIQKSKIRRQRVESGALVIKPALYHLDSGLVKFY